MQFTYKAYSDLICYLRDNGYTISNYHDFDKFKKVAILRHDVDMSIDKALKMAKLEHEQRVCSTYFLLLSTDFYNVASKSSISQINQMQELGHEIGLHFDETKYGNISKLGGVLPYLHDEVNALEIIIGTSIKAVSMHRPSNEMLEVDHDFDGIVNTYSKTFFHDFKYASDSRRNWREDVLGIIGSGQFERLHILTHPFWYNENELTLKESIVGFIDESKKERYHSIRDNIKGLDEIVTEKEVLKW